MIESIDKDKSQKILGYKKKNYWYFNNYAQLNGIDNQRFVCAGIAYSSFRFGFNPKEFKEDNFKILVDGYSKVATEIYRGQENIDSKSYKERGFCFPYDWEYNAFALNVLYFYMEDLEFLEDSNNRGYVTIKAYLEYRATKDKPYFPPDLEQVAKRKILDLWFWREHGREGKEGIKNFFSFHLQKYKGSPSEFMKYILSFMIEVCLEDTIDNIRLFAEFKAWHDEKSKELGFTTNQLTNKDNGKPNTSATVEEGKSHKKPYSAKVILEVIEKINEGENILPKNLSGKAMYQEYAKVIKTILGELFDYSAGTLQNNHKLPLDNTEQGQVFDILKKYGYDDLANQYRLKDRIKD
jgi:hypothetical protein